MLLGSEIFIIIKPTNFPQEEYSLLPMTPLIRHHLSSVFKQVKQSKYLQWMMLILLMGITLRICLFATQRSLWLDEAMLARNIIDRPLFALLFQPLDYNQGAPVLLLLVEKISTLIFGKNDFALRLFPLLCSITLIPVVMLLSSKALGRTAGIVSGILISLSPSLINYASEVKQYAVDAAVCFAVLFLFYWFDQQKIKPSHVWLLAPAGIIAAALSHPALFLLAGCGLVYGLRSFLQAKQSNQYSHLKRLLLVYGSWAVFYGAYYLLSLRHLSGNEYLSDYWKEAFFPYPPWQNLNFLYEFFLGQVQNYSPVPQITVLIALLSIIGYVYLWKKTPFTAGSILVALVGLMTASVLRLYPMQGRLITFIIPFSVLIVGASAQWIYSLTQKRKRWAAVGVGIFCLVVSFHSLESLYGMATNPDKRQREHILPLLEILEEQRQTDEPLYIYYGSMHAYLYYQTIQQRHDDPLYMGGRHRGDPDAYLVEIDELSQYPAAWFLFSHTIVYEGINEEQYILEYLNQIGTQIKRFDQTGASLYLYEFAP